MGSGCRNDCRAGVEEFCKRGCTCEREVEGEVFSCENKAGEERRGGADRIEIGKGFGGFDQC